MDNFLDRISGPFGALVLCVVFLSFLFDHYQTIINTSLQEHREDRAMYQKTMLELSKSMQSMSNDLEDIKSSIKE